MKYLLIIANPNPTSFSFKILSKIESIIKKNNHDYSTIDLYRDEPKQDFYTHEENGSVKYYQKLISEADQVVFIHPIYWCSPPAILKNFLEQNFREDFAYRYSTSGDYQALLKGKSMTVIVTSNESEETYQEAGEPFKILWEEFSLGTGITMKDLLQIGDMRDNIDSREQIISELESRITWD